MTLSPSTANSAPTTPLSATEDPDWRCGYAGKRCPNERTSKKGGGLHRFCEFHRQRANKNQWRVDRKRRAVRALRRQQLKQSKALTRSMSMPDPVDISADHAAPTLDDIDLLQVMLLGGSDCAVVADCKDTQSYDEPLSPRLNMMFSFRDLLLS